MSYCRFSSDDFKCDVYCYASCYGGYVTHVAGKRHVGATPIPELPEFGTDEASQQAWLAAYQAQRAWLDAAELKPIGLSLDGEDFHDDTAAAAADRLEQIRAAGYYVPQYAIDDLRSEADDDATVESIAPPNSPTKSS